MKLSSRALCLTIILTLTGICSTYAQRRLPSYEKYIKQYSNLAIEHQRKYGIPASITLAQGIRESGAGQSNLAKKSNNHFGIKCHTDWKGGRVYHDDDLRGECFRKYKKVEDSYEDHSRFLKDRPRYAKLFKLKQTDYKGWARGLKDCGYATDKNYANKLIKVIEDYDLHKLDTKAGRNAVKNAGNATAATGALSHTIYKTHGLIYVHARGGDTFESIAAVVGTKAKTLRKYNEVPAGYPLKDGDIVYLQKKKKKADKPHYEHVVKAGESMHSISQQYGIQLDALYKRNKKGADYAPQKGDILKLR